VAGSTIGSAVINLKGNSSGFLSDLESAISGAKSKISGMGNDMASGLSGVGSVMTAGITLPIVAMGAFAVKSFEDINTAQDQLIGKTNVTGAAAQQMRQSFNNVFGNTPESASDVVSAMTAVHDKLGLTGTALEQTSTQALDLSRILGTDVTSTVSGVTKLFQAFSVPTKDMSADMDQLYTVSTHSGVALTDLTTAVSKVSAVAKPAGLSMQQTEAAVGAFATSGLPARQSASLLTTAIGDFTKAGIPASKALQDIANGNATAAEKQAILGKGSAASIATWDKLTGSLSKAKGGYNDMTNAIDHSKGSIASEAQSTMTLSQKFDELKNKAEVAFAPLGGVIVNILMNLVTAATPLVSILTKVLSVFSDMPAPIQMVVVVLGGILAAIGPILMILPQLVEGFGMLQTAFAFVSGGGIAEAFGGIASTITETVIPAAMEGATAFAAMVLPLLPIILIVAAIGIGLYLLYTYFKPFHDAVNEVVGWVKELVGDLASGNFGKFGADFAAGIHTAINDLINFDWGGLGNKIKIGIETALATFGTWLWGLIQPLPMKLWSAYIGIWAQIGTWLWGLIQPLPQKLWSALQSAIGTFGAWLWGLISPIPGELGSNIQSAISGFGAWLMSAASGFFGGLPGKIQGAISGLGDWLISAASGFATWLSNAVQNAIKQLPGGSQALSAGGTVASAAGGAVNAVTSLQTGGTITSSGLFNLHAGEAVIPPENTTDMGGNYTFTVNFNNATIQSQAQAETFSRIMAYQATSLMRRQGLSRG
jgi:phage-related minor tail protein